MLKVNPSLIRFWEKEFPALRPQKNRKGNRLFTEADIETLRHIHKLVKEDGFTLQGAREQMKNRLSVSAGHPEVAERLEKIRQEMLRIRSKLG